jgi:hypothetical protein
VAAAAAVEKVPPEVVARLRRVRAMVDKEFM